MFLRFLFISQIILTLDNRFAHPFPVHYSIRGKSINSTKAVKALEDPNLLFGDIVVNKKLSDKYSLRNALPSENFLWPNGVVPIAFHPFRDDIKSLVTRAIEHIHSRTCVRFKQWNGESDYVKIIYGDGCYSSVGRDGGMQTLSLSDGCENVGSIVHELMHVLGFYHEQNRSDRDDYVLIITENILEKNLRQFKKLNYFENRLLTPYDYYSIMHYASDAFSKNGEDTMVPLKHGVVLTHPRFKEKLSADDVVKIRKLYQCDDIDN